MSIKEFWIITTIVAILCLSMGYNVGYKSGYSSGKQQGILIVVNMYREMHNKLAFKTYEDYENNNIPKQIEDKK